MERTLVAEVAKKAGQEVLIKGWVHTRRDHGKLVFIDVRDRSGLLQVVFIPSNKEAHELAQKLRSEYVVAVTGQINERPANMVNDKLPTGGVEMLATGLEIINEAKTPPFEIDQDTIEVNEELRLKYRYLDLRSLRMANNLAMRSKANKFFRDYLEQQGFLEIETPILTKGTPEGAREFLVPSRQWPGKFYVLPQSPQQFKQLLMVAGAEKYFQIARCFRDEDTRGDRQAEFTQLDIEMSFIEQEDIFNLIEPMMIELVEKLYPNKKILAKPFPRLTYAECLEKYGTDKPDLRPDKNDPDLLAFMWLIDPPMFKHSETENKLVASHHPFTMPNREDMEKYPDEPKKWRAYGYDLVLNGFEVAGGSIRIHLRDVQQKVFELLGVGENEIKTRFGHILEAFEFGAPPHGGIAPGVDRLLAILHNEPNIREVIVFPKTGDSRDLMMDAPNYTSLKALREANIRIADSVEARAEKDGVNLYGEQTQTAD
ncbi:MAG: aspartate--tRNA ligase [Patescibacteria group bacterium]|jgi:aspartyl-tRNA synthetase